MRLRCPNEPEDKTDLLTSPARHEAFVQTFQGTYEKQLISNGRQWGLDKPVIRGEQPISTITCVTCGAEAIEEHEEKAAV